MDALAPVHVATIVSTRGNRGEVAAVCPSGRPERLQAIRQVKLGRKGEAPGGEPHELSGNWVHKGRWILHFQGFETISRAESLVGWEVYLDECDLPMLPEGHVYTYRLVGARVQDPQGRLLGYVQDTETGAAHDYLLVERLDGDQVMVPMSAGIVRHLDAENGYVTVDAPAGLLEGEPEVVG